MAGRAERTPRWYLDGAVGAVLERPASQPTRQLRALALRGRAPIAPLPRSAMNWRGIGSRNSVTRASELGHVERKRSAAQPGLMRTVASAGSLITPSSRSWGGLSVHALTTGVARGPVAAAAPRVVRPARVVDRARTAITTNRLVRPAGRSQWPCAPERGREHASLAGSAPSVSRRRRGAGDCR